LLATIVDPETTLQRVEKILNLNALKSKNFVKLAMLIRFIKKQSKFFKIDVLIQSGG